MEQYRRFWSLLLITLSVVMVSMACDDHRDSLPTNSTEQVNQTVNQTVNGTVSETDIRTVNQTVNQTVTTSMPNCMFNVTVKEVEVARHKFNSTGRPVAINASTFYINATITPSPSMKWRTEKKFVIAFLIWGDFREENGDFLQLNRRVFRGATRCRPVPVLIHSQRKTSPRTVLVGLRNNSGLATLKFAHVVLNPSFWSNLQDILFCKEVLEYVGTSDARLQSLKDILTSDATTYLYYVNKLQESDVHICNIFQIFKTHCNGYYAANSCSSSGQ